jgi:hypothetical protein
LMELSPSSSTPNVLVALPLDVRNACVFLGSPDSGWYTMDRRPALAGPPVARRHWLAGRPANWSAISAAVRTVHTCIMRDVICEWASAASAGAKLITE